MTVGVGVAATRTSAYRARMVAVPHADVEAVAHVATTTTTPRATGQQQTPQR